MDTSDEEISFDDQGRCHHCTSYANNIAHHAGMVSAEIRAQQLAKAVGRMKREGKGRRYDCVIGLSGGVDSSYVALKVKELGLRPLAVHVDNGWNTETAVANVERVVRGLKLDLYTEVLDWEEFRDLQVAFLRGGTPDYEIPTDHAIIASVFKTAWRFRVRSLVMGYNVASELVLPPTWARGHFDWWYIKSVNERFGRGRLRTFPHFGPADYLRYRVTTARSTLNLLNFIDYSRDRAIGELEAAIGWRNYGGKHYESIYTRFIQGHVLPERFGYDKRRAHLSSLILAGKKTREEALAQLEKSTYESEALRANDRIYVMKKLGLSEADFDAIMSAPKRTIADFESLFDARSFRAARTLYRAARSSIGSLRTA